MSQITKSVGATIGLAVVIGLAMPWASSAQAAAEKKALAGPVEIEEITVTAQKREENIQETPISVTALTGATLQEQGVSNILDLKTSVPNLRVSDTPASPSSAVFSIRGISAAQVDPASQTKVGFYMDGAYIAQTAGSAFDLEDIQRVEVLRGPQGTLYGKNTIGGAINFITNKPTEERSITLKTEIGNFETFNSRMTFNLPLIGKNGFFQSDAIGTVSLRETVGYKTHDGYFRNALAPGQPTSPLPSGGSGYDSLNRIFTTTALRWQPSKDITVDYSFEYHRYHDQPAAFQLTYVYPGSIPSLPTLPQFYAVPYIMTNRSDVIPNTAQLGTDLKSLHQLRDDSNHGMHNLTAAWDLGDVGPLGSVTLKSIAMYRTFEFQEVVDISGTPLHLLDSHNFLDTQSWSEELQWIGTAPRFHYVAGAYYFGDYDCYDDPHIAFGGVITGYKNFHRDQAYAPYGQATWTPPILNDKLSVTAGVRYTQEQVHMTHIYGSFPHGTPPKFIQDGGSAFGIHGAGVPGLSPMGDISYQWTDQLMTYARVSRGFTSGGINGTGSDPRLFTVYKPETLLQYEAGIKSQWLDNRVRVNTSGFYSDYRNLQQTVFQASPGGGVLQIQSNVDSAEIWGMEFEGTVIPFRGMEATVNYAFLAPKYLKWEDQKFDVNGNPVFDPSTGKAVLENVANQRAFGLAPHNTASAGLTYTAPPTTAGVFSAHLDVSWQDKEVFVTNNNTPGSQADEGWAYALLNGRLTFAGIPLQQGSLDLAVFGRNLFDRKYRTFGIDFGSALGLAGNSYGAPRTFGLQLTYKLAES